MLEGGHYERGMKLGKWAGGAVRYNVFEFWRMAEAQGFGRGFLLSGDRAGVRDPDVGDYLRGLARGSGVRYEDLMAFNAFKHAINPDECTVMIAMKDSTATGKTTMLKNSDKVGSEKLVGSNFHRNKEINIMVVEKPDNGNKFVAVAAAGEVSIKMGMNDKGVATGSNISRTTELRERKVGIGQVRALDRGWLMREGIIRGSTAEEASKFVTGELVRNPMSTPGNIEFVDSGTAVVIEGSYDRLAVQRISSGVAARSNRFVVLHELNDPLDISSYARYVRATKLLEDNRGKLDPGKMIEFSQDHENGPGPNSICRHHPDFRSETSLAAAVMEIDGPSPSKSRFYAALGKPCQAWPSEDAHTVVALDGDSEEIPSGFLTGSVWKQFYTEEPKATAFSN
ncbi:MAG TPA: C45 family peptidase [Nitrososphaerales archaeon]|nr:C45 family peptidase [Nitrososphaerales archaeon]